MSDDPSLAFAELSERARAEAGNPPARDRISLRNYERKAEIGAFQAERGNTQRIRFNVVVEITPQSAPPGDDVDHILSYDSIAEAIDAALGQERLNLLESLAERIAELILRSEKAARVFLRIEKLDRGPYELGVEIVRDRTHLQGDPVAADPVPAQVVFLANSLLKTQLLPAWLDRLDNARPAAILVADPDPAAILPETADPVARQRIALLAWDQAAWALAGRDQRLAVVSSRTEIVWALRNGQLTVWAPSKLVLDATDPPPPDPGQPIALAAWLRRKLGADRLVVVGAGVPAGIEATALAPEAPFP